jgi:hypothetical protein
MKPRTMSAMPRGLPRLCMRRLSRDDLHAWSCQRRVVFQSPVAGLEKDWQLDRTGLIGN